MIISFICMTLRFDGKVVMWGEIRRQSFLGVKAWKVHWKPGKSFVQWILIGRVWNLRDWKWVIGDQNFKARHATSRKSRKCCLWKTVFKVQSICNFDLLHLIQSTDDEKELLCFKHKSISKTSPLLFFCFVEPLQITSFCDQTIAFGDWNKNV